MIGLALDQSWLILLGLAFAVTAAGAMLLFTERHQDEWMEEEVQWLEGEHARLSDQLITAEQEERRRLALVLHDGPVQSMSGIALMLDGVLDAVEEGRTDEATQVLGMSNSIQIDLEVDAADGLTEHAQVAIFQIIREALHQAIRRGPPTRMSVRVAEVSAGVEAVIQDDAPGERRRASYEAITERALSLNGRMTIDADQDGGTVVRVVFPPYRVRR